MLTITSLDELTLELYVHLHCIVYAHVPNVSAELKSRVIRTNDVGCVIIIIEVYNERLVLLLCTNIMPREGPISTNF